MKKLFFLTIILSFFGIIQAQTLTIDGTTYAVDTLENHQVGPGTYYVSLRLTANNRLDVYFLKTDLTNPYVQIRTALGRDSIYSGETVTSVAKRKSTEGAYYFAGTNGDFYMTTGYVGYPVSGSMVDSEIARIPGPRNTFIIDDQKIPDIGVITYNGEIKFNNQNWAINSVNHLRGDNQLVLYNRHNGKYTRTNSFGTEVLIELLEGYSWGTNKALKAKVLKIEKNIGWMAIPKGQAVLSGHGIAKANLDQLQLNDEIELSLGLSVNSNNTSNFTAMTGGDNYAMMLKNGIVEQSNVWSDRHPRTGLGYSQNKMKLIFCVVDGRGVSVGVSTKQLAELMKSAGAHDAFNMDGGGSSTMYISEYGKAVNRTSDGAERAVSNSIFVVSTAPTDKNVSEIRPHESKYKLPYLGEYVPKFYAFNQYGVLLDSALQNVVLTCDPSLGTINGNKYIANGSTSGQITATYNGNVVTNINIEFVPVSGIKIALDSVLMDNRVDYPIEVLATTEYGDALISPAAFTWVVDNPEIGKVENGVIQALKNGTTLITGHLESTQSSVKSDAEGSFAPKNTSESITDQIKLTVEIPENPAIIGDSIKLGDWKLTASTFLNANWNKENLPVVWETGAAVNFVHGAGRVPFIRLENQRTLYGLPDTVKVVMNIGDMSISRALITLKSNLYESSILENNAFKQNQDFTLDVPVDKMFNVKNRANYPLKFDNIYFFLDPANLTTGKAYTLALKEIVLVYKDYIITSTISEKQSYFQIFPNPIGKEKELSIKLNNDEVRSDLEIRLFDLSGKLIKYDKKSNITAEHVNFSIEGIESGNYLLQVNSGIKSQSVKIIVK